MLTQIVYQLQDVILCSYQKKEVCKFAVIATVKQLGIKYYKIKLKKYTRNVTVMIRLQYNKYIFFCYLDLTARLRTGPLPRR